MTTDLFPDLVSTEPPLTRARRRHEEAKAALLNAQDSVDREALKEAHAKYQAAYQDLLMEERRQMEVRQ